MAGLGWMIGLVCWAGWAEQAGWAIWLRCLALLVGSACCLTGWTGLSGLSWQAGLAGVAWLAELVSRTSRQNWTGWAGLAASAGGLVWAGQAELPGLGWLVCLGWANFLKFKINFKS